MNSKIKAGCITEEMTLNTRGVSKLNSKFKIQNSKVFKKGKMKAGYIINAVIRQDVLLRTVISIHILVEQL